MATQQLHDANARPTNDQISQLEIVRLGRVAGARLLAQHFFALCERYEALTAMVKQPQATHLAIHATLCYQVLSSDSEDQWLDRFDFLQQTNYQTRSALVDCNLPATRHLLTAAALQMSGLRSVMESVEVSLEYLESAQLAFELRERQNQLRVNLQNTARDYIELCLQWNQIHSEVRKGAKVSLGLPHACVSAFQAPFKGITAFQTSTRRLEFLIQGIDRSTVALDFDGAAQLLQHGESLDGTLQQFVANLRRAVGECRAAQARAHGPTIALATAKTGSMGRPEDCELATKASKRRRRQKRLQEARAAERFQQVAKPLSERPSPVGREDMATEQGSDSTKVDGGYTSNDPPDESHSMEEVEVDHSSGLGRVEGSQDIREQDSKKRRKRRRGEKGRKQ